MGGKPYGLPLIHLRGFPYLLASGRLLQGRSCLRRRYVDLIDLVACNFGAGRGRRDDGDSLLGRCWEPILGLDFGVMNGGIGCTMVLALFAARSLMNGFSTENRVKNKV